MAGMQISDEAAQKAFSYLHEAAEPAAVARGQRIQMENYLKVVKAEQMIASGQTSVASQERDAYASNAYKEQLLALEEAVRCDELYRWKRDQAHALIEAWRTWNANQRGVRNFT